MIKLISFFLLLIASYFGWWAITYAAVEWWCGTFLLAACAVGLLLRWKAAKYFWNTIALVASLGWLISIVRLVLKGWPTGDYLDTVISLIPGALLLTVCFAGSQAVAAHYRVSGKTEKP
ncbi:hypothetical protein [Collimonas fungivorans]|uniref:hypothetical protein n=1 Tax=Collimonas fungivorans TaxID=158899 RepID=UPI0005A06EF1|nr:hypothetical protein [Collimonas fungivorans]